MLLLNRILPTVILFVSAVVVLGGYEKKKEPPTPQDIDIMGWESHSEMTAVSEPQKEKSSVDLNKLESYKENNRLEAKAAQGGIPKSIWGSVCAFANKSLKKQCTPFGMVSLIFWFQ